jgi:hypothetical protein
MRLRLLLVTASVLALAGTAAARSPHEEQFRPVKADMAFAARVMLARGDLGAGWNAATLPGWQNDTCAGFDPDVSMYTMTGRAQSAFSHSAGAYAASVVVVMRSAADAAGDFAKSVRPQVAQCFGASFSKGAKVGGASVRVRYARMLTAPRIGDQAALYRLRVDLSAGKSVVPVYTDAYVIRRDRVMVALVLMNARRPFPNGLVLARYLADRSSIA